MYSSKHDLKRSAISKKARPTVLPSNRWRWLAVVLCGSVLVFLGTPPPEERVAQLSPRARTPLAPPLPRASLREGVPAPEETQVIPPEAPNQTRELGYALISRWHEQGRFDLASHYALSSRNEFRRDLVIAAFHEWGRRQPELALRGVLQIPDTAERQIAFQSVLSGWARTEPERMAEVALQIPDGDEKTFALTKALRSWLNRDPWNAGDWILAHESVVPIAEELFRKDRR